MKTTRTTIEAYFAALNRKIGWEDFIADDLVFTGMKTQTIGKDAYVQATAGFLTLVRSVKIERLIAEGDEGCVLAQYELAAPTGKTLNCAIAELFSVKNGQLTNSTIFFDTASFNKFLS
jgi:ketosteroid isomerase-like protein